MQDLAIIISTTLMYSTPLIYTALGGVFSENSGIVNIGLEGMMTIGAFAGAAAGVLTGNPWLAFLIGGLAGAFFALIHAIATVKFNADHTISGVAINLLAPGFALFLAKIMFDGATTTPTIPMENKIPRIFNGTFPAGSVLDTIFNNYATVYLAFILVIVAYYILYKTKFGLRIRSVGEHPGAADTLGINVSKVRYSGSFNIWILSRSWWSINVSCFSFFIQTYTSIRTRVYSYGSCYIRKMETSMGGACLFIIWFLNSIISILWKSNITIYNK